MEIKDLDWGNIGFNYRITDYRYVSNFKDGKWDDGELLTDSNVTINESAGILQYCQEVFEGLKYAIIAGKHGGSAPTVFNAANEWAVDKFINKTPEKGNSKKSNFIIYIVILLFGILGLVIFKLRMR